MNPYTSMPPGQNPKSKLKALKEELKLLETDSFQEGLLIQERIASLKERIEEKEKHIKRIKQKKKESKQPPSSPKPFPKTAKPPKVEPTKPVQTQRWSIGPNTPKSICASIELADIYEFFRKCEIKLANTRKNTRNGRYIKDPKNGFRQSHNFAVLCTVAAGEIGNQDETEKLQSFARDLMVLEQELDQKPVPYYTERRIPIERIKKVLEIVARWAIDAEPKLEEIKSKRKAEITKLQNEQEQLRHTFLQNLAQGKQDSELEGKLTELQEKIKCKNSQFDSLNNLPEHKKNFAHIWPDVKNLETTQKATESEAALPDTSLSPPAL